MDRLVSGAAGGNVALDLFVVGQHLGALLEEALAGSGLSPAHYAVYSQIADGADSPKALIEALGLRPATLSGYLSAMERRGDLRRSRAEADRRSHVLVLTDQGAARHADARRAFRTTLQALDRRLGGAGAVTRARAELGRINDAILGETSSS